MTPQQKNTDTQAGLRSEARAQNMKIDSTRDSTQTHKLKDTRTDTISGTVTHTKNGNTDTRSQTAPNTQKKHTQTH